MKLLVVNPNISEVVLDVIVGAAERAAAADTTIVGVHSPHGTRNIDCSYGDYATAPYMIEAVRSEVASEQPDAVVLAGFGNVGIFALREILSIPVISISESSMALACQLGHRFTTLTMLEQFIPYQQDIVRLFGFEAKCASVRAINVNVERAAIERDRVRADLTEQVHRIIDTDGAEVVILACAGLCGYEAEISERTGIPVLDPVAVGVKTAETMVSLGLVQSKIRKFAFPPQPIGDYHLDN